MKSPEIKAFIKKELDPVMIREGFVSKPEKGVLFNYQKKESEWTCEVNGYLLTYNDHVLVYLFHFGLTRIVEILKEIDAITPLDSYNPYKINDTFMVISPGVILFPMETERPYKSFRDEAGLRLILFDIEAFYLSYVQPFCEKYSDFTKLDKLFNRLDDFREEGPVFPGLAYFPVTRLIIAKLANNPDYEQIVELNFQWLERQWASGGHSYDRNDTTKPEVVAASYLRGLTILIPVTGS